MPKFVPFVFAWGSEDVVLLNIYWKVLLTLIQIIRSWLMLLVLLTSSRLRLQASTLVGKSL
jgi:hypothetical protein